MSESPRTDFLLSQDVDAVEFVNLARELERELAELRANNANLIIQRDADLGELAEVSEKLGECWTRHDNMADENQKLRTATIEECANACSKAEPWWDWEHYAAAIRALKDKP